MFVDIYLTDTETGYSGVYHDTFDWQDVANDWPASAAIIYQYTEGNYSCDCNLSDFLYDRDASKEKPCGDTIHLEKIIDRANGEIIWDSKRQEQEDAQIRLALKYGMRFLANLN